MPVRPQPYVLAAAPVLCLSSHPWSCSSTPSPCLETRNQLSQYTLTSQRHEGCIWGEHSRELSSFLLG